MTPLSRFLAAPLFVHFPTLLLSHCPILASAISLPTDNSPWYSLRRLSQLHSSHQPARNTDIMGEPSRPSVADLGSKSTSDALGTLSENAAAGRKRKGHRGGKKKRGRRQSFAVDDHGTSLEEAPRISQDSGPTPSSRSHDPFSRLYQSGARNLSSTSLESEALLDHR